MCSTRKGRRSKLQPTNPVCRDWLGTLQSHILIDTLSITCASDSRPLLLDRDYLILTLVSPLLYTSRAFFSRLRKVCSLSDLSENGVSEQTNSPLEFNCFCYAFLESLGLVVSWMAFLPFALCIVIR